MDNLRQLTTTESQALEVIAPSTYSLEAQASISGELAQRWLAYIDRTPKTISTYNKAIKLFINYLHDRGISAPSRETILEYKRDLAARGIKASSINNYLIAIRQFFSWLDMEGIYKDITRNIHGEKIAKGHKKDYFTIPQCKELLGKIDRSTLQGKRDFALVFLLMTDGLRTIEINRANIEDIGTMGGYSVLFVQGKGRADKTDFVKLPTATEQYIREYLAARGETDGKAPLFTSLSHRTAGQRMSTRAISAIAKETMRAAGFNDSRHTAHSLRHSTATNALLLNGGNIRQAAQLLRHESTTTTEGYAHDLDKMNNNCADLIAAALID